MSSRVSTPNVRGVLCDKWACRSVDSKCGANTVYKARSTCVIRQEECEDTTTCISMCPNCTADRGAAFVDSGGRLRK
eukprot:6549279-Alexandrium_andersonii.AAC.1